MLSLLSVNIPVVGYINRLKLYWYQFVGRSQRKSQTFGLYRKYKQNLKFHQNYNTFDHLSLFDKSFW